MWLLLKTLNSRSNKLIISSRSKYFPLQCDNHMLHFSVKIIIPYKGLHLYLAIIPEEYNIIIYCHREWQWETVLMYSIAKTKKRQWSGLLSRIWSYLHACPVDATHCPLRLVSNQMQKYKKSIKMCREFKKNATWSDKYKKHSIKESVCSSLWWHCRNRQHIAMCGWVMFIHSQQGRVPTYPITRLVCSASVALKCYRRC